MDIFTEGSVRKKTFLTIKSHLDKPISRRFSLSMDVNLPKPTCDRYSSLVITECHLYNVNSSFTRMRYKFPTHIVIKNG